MHSRTRFTPHSRRPTPPGWTDLSVGSLQFGIRLPVLLESRVLRDYGEVEPGLGLNTAGIILSVLSCRLAVPSEDTCFTVAVLRRGDGSLTEIALRFERDSVGSQECLMVQLVHERPIRSPHPAVT